VDRCRDQRSDLGSKKARLQSFDDVLTQPQSLAANRTDKTVLQRKRTLASASPTTALPRITVIGVPVGINVRDE
jgi:hypothetical protein